jgi:hypothetical protein
MDHAPNSLFSISDNDDYRGMELVIGNLTSCTVCAFLVEVSLTSHTAASRDLLKPYGRGLYVHCAIPRV